MTKMTRPGSRDDFFTWLLASDRRSAHAALEKMVDELHTSKEFTVRRFLEHTGSEDFLWALVKLLGSKTARVAGNAAYIVGTLAESDYGCHRIVSLADSHHKEGKQILPDLVNLLSSDDAESVMNAAGTIGTLAETEQGRAWLLREPTLRRVLEGATSLLNSENAWTASNASLVLARLTISEDGCNAIMDHGGGAFGVVSQLIASLGSDEAGKGMNCAFAIGRLCDTARGRALLLSLPETGRMLTHLTSMLCSVDAGSSKNACFAISSLAASSEGHNRLLGSSVCDRVLAQLAQLLSSADPETGWFAAMTLRTVASRPSGCLKLRETPKIISSLQEAAKTAETGGDEKRKEIQEALLLVKYLDKPAPPFVKALSSRSVEISWPKVETRCRFDVTYKVIDGGSNCVYSGGDVSCVIDGLTPCTQYVYRLRACTTADDSPVSDVTAIILDEDVPGVPSNVRVLASTTSQLKVGWDPPEEFCGLVKSYYIYLGGNLVESTLEASCIMSGLTANTSYDVSVCAATCKGKGPRAAIVGTTSPQGAHAPSKPQLTVLGRSEIGVTWNPPEVPLGRINRYDVLMNGKVVFSGTDLHFTARQLQPNTEYTFVVSVITNEGKQDSKSARKKTPKDEYDQQRTPLYTPPQRDESKPQEGSSSTSVTAAILSLAVQPKKKKKRQANTPLQVDKPSSGRSSRRETKDGCGTVAHTRHAVKLRYTSKSSARSCSPTPSGHCDVPTIKQDVSTEATPIAASKPPVATTARLAQRDINDKLEPAYTELRVIDSGKSSNTSSASSSKEDTRAAYIITDRPPPAIHKLSETLKPRQDTGDIGKMSRSLTRLAVTSFNPNLPPAQQQPVMQRSMTMMGPPKLLLAASRHSLRSPSGGTVSPGPLIPGQVFESLVAAKTPVTGSQGRFVPMQFRTQPMNLPNMKRPIDAHSILMRRAGTNVEEDPSLVWRTGDKPW